ncbi:MAG: hypothetical protein QXV49_01040 [Conexivisphaerales archaeon]
MLWKRPDIVHYEITGAGERSQSSTVIGMRATLTRYRSRKANLDKIRNIRYSKGVFMIRGEDRGKVVSYLRKRGATVVLWIPSRKKKSSWSYRSFKYLFNTAYIETVVHGIIANGKLILAEVQLSELTTTSEKFRTFQG